MEDFTGKIVVITGAASGLGRAIAFAFARAGASLSLADINADGLDQTATELTQLTTLEPLLTAVDLASRDACIGLIDATVQHFGGVDVLCNNAGILGANRLADVSEDQWHALMNINLAAPFWLSQAAMPHLIARGGNIVNTASSGATLGEAYLIPYTASKAAIVQMTKSMAMEFLKENVRINSISPGGMFTNIMSTGDFPADADMDLVARYMGVRSAVEPTVVADLILYVASERAKNIHGANLATDGGVTAG